MGESLGCFDNNETPLEREVDDIRPILNMGVASREDRIRNEGLLSEILPNATNEAITVLWKEGGYGFKYIDSEFEARVLGGTQFKLTSLFEIGECVNLWGSLIKTKNSKRLFSLILAGIKTSSPVATPEEIAAVLVQYSNSTLDINCGFLDQILSWREDRNEIIENIKKRETREYVCRYLEGALARAQLLTEER